MGETQPEGGDDLAPQVCICDQLGGRKPNPVLDPLRMEHDPRCPLCTAREAFAAAGESDFLPALPPITDDEAFALVRTIEMGLARLGMREGDHCSLLCGHHGAEVAWLHEAVARGDLRRLRLRLGGHS